MSDDLMRTARECSSCGYLTIHPLIYCPKCPGRFSPVIITRERYLERKAEFKIKEEQENSLFNSHKER
jgi:hypothetical protein